MENGTGEGGAEAEDGTEYVYVWEFEVESRRCGRERAPLLLLGILSRGRILSYYDGLPSIVYRNTKYQKSSRISVMMKLFC